MSVFYNTNSRDDLNGWWLHTNGTPRLSHPAPDEPETAEEPEEPSDH
ncbi:hypothetical protein [Streptomyces sp. NPDC002067]